MDRKQYFVQDDDLGMDLGLGEEATHSSEIIEEEYHYEVNLIVKFHNTLYLFN